LTIFVFARSGKIVSAGFSYFIGFTNSRFFNGITRGWGDFLIVAFLISLPEILAIAGKIRLFTYLPILEKSSMPVFPASSALSILVFSMELQGVGGTF